MINIFILVWGLLFCGARGDRLCVNSSLLTYILYQMNSFSRYIRILNTYRVRKPLITFVDHIRLSPINVLQTFSK